MKIILVSLLTVLIFVLINQYLFCPVYTFPEPVPFAGDQLYNPYAATDSGSWYKCNFHAHSNAWHGLTNGEAKDSTIWNNYDSLGYAVHCVSEYQKINSAFSSQQNYIPAYEHGYNCRKTHQLVLGSYHTTWLDYFFPQTLSNKQYVLDHLNEAKNIVILNHPQLKKGYNCQELRYLGNYQCMEVLNPSVTSFSQWDAALSAGKPVFIVGNDDSHHVNNLCSIGRECTWLNLRSMSQNKVLSALRKGESYAMHIPVFPYEPIAQRINRLKHELPSLKKCVISNDTLYITMNTKAKEILFTGQGGKSLTSFSNTDHAWYVIKKEDLYVRSSISFDNGTAIFLNPVFRHDGNPFNKNNTAIVNHSKSVLFFLFGLNILVVWLTIAYALLFNSRKEHRTFLTDNAGLFAIAFGLKKNKYYSIN